MKLSYSIFILFIICTLVPDNRIYGQYLGDESDLYAETKQVNQFFKRFNCEEYVDGKSMPETDSLYHHPKLRKNYLERVFDNYNLSIKHEVKRSFIKDVLNEEQPVFLKFHSGDWFAEVKARFRFKGRRVEGTLFMVLQEEPVGSKWVFKSVYFPFFDHQLRFDHSLEDPFLHPLSHELDFMNLIKAFPNKEDIQKYAHKNFRPDHLSLFIYEIKNDNLNFEMVSDVKFHFFQVENWYFTLEEFNRSGDNSGWLIADLVKLEADGKNVLLQHILHKN